MIPGLRKTSIVPEATQSDSRGNPDLWLKFKDAQINLTDSKHDFEALSTDYFKLLCAFAEDTIESCSFYRKRFERFQIRRVPSFESFQNLPLLSPDEVRATSPLNLVPDQLTRILKVGRMNDLPSSERLVWNFMTTSSTGKPKVSYYTAADWEASCSMIWRLNHDLPNVGLIKVFNCFHMGHAGGRYVENAFAKFGALVENRQFAFVTLDQTLMQLSTHLAELGGFNTLAIPPWRPAGPTKGVTLDELLNADVENYVGRNIRIIVIAGAPSDTDVRIRERVWEANDLAGAPRTHFSERYGSSEVGIAAFECKSGELHTVPGFVYTEVVNEKTGKPVSNGERGLVALTGLHHGSRYLRYLVGDEATYVSDACNCGRLTPRLKQIRRVLEPERLKGGCASGGY